VSLSEFMAVINATSMTNRSLFFFTLGWTAGVKFVGG